tara:strand:- start:96 stop:737 length:642 start_codon:yes stop_codon:yes gene_type:complete
MNQLNLELINKNSYLEEDFLISNSNKDAFQSIIEKSIKINNIYLYGPNKSGKSHLASIWLKRNNGINIELNKITNQSIIEINQNILIEDIYKNLNEEKLFFLINNINEKNKKILITSNNKPLNYNFKIKDLSSRIKSFYFLEIKKPDDYLLTNLIIKLFNDKQIKIKDKKVISYIISHIDRTFDNVFLAVKKIDEYSLSNNREINIPLIKEII